MFNKDFKYCQRTLNYNIINQFNGTMNEKNLLFSMMCEWNVNLSVSSLCKYWRKERPKNILESFTILLWNCECLNTHISDLDVLLSLYCPHMCILTGVGKRICNLPSIPQYKWFSKKGNNSFGGVAMLVHNYFNTSIIDESENFLLIQLELLNEKIYIGAVYIPPKCTPPLDLFDRHKEKDIFIFGDYNAKHESWKCERNNVSGNKLKEWMDDNGFEVIHCNRPTSKKSNSVIDFGIGKNIEKWSVDRLEEGTSDHYPVLFFSPFTSNEKGVFKKTNWNLFTFFLQSIYPYWTSLVYNLEYNVFFNLFSEFLAALCDRSSEYVSILKFRPPWPPFLVNLAKSVNKMKRKFRRTRYLGDYYNFSNLRKVYTDEKIRYEQQTRERKISNMKEANNIWTHVKYVFRPYSPSFRGLKIKDKICKDNHEIVQVLANFYEKSLDSTDISAFLLKKLPYEYLHIITILFNKCAEAGEFFEKGKIAKGICLSKDGAFPTEDRLRSISLLPNLAKVFERVVVERIERWCKNNGVYVDEQSGFTENRRLQTRILSLIEDLRMTVAAPNRPALTLFIDFLTAFDRMWYPGLMYTLEKLDMPIELRKWIFNWLQNREMFFCHGDGKSRTIKVAVGAPQGSVLAALLFRLHIFFLPSYFPQFTCHLFADDLTILVKGTIERRLSDNIKYVQDQATTALKSLEKFADDHLLPVNVKKTKGMMVHNAVAVDKPEIFYKNDKIEYVKTFKFLGIEIGTKLGLGKHIQDRLKKVKTSYTALRKIYKSIPKNEIKIRKRLFCAFSLPHLIWLFSTWFMFTEKQRQKIEHVYGTGLRLVYNLQGYEDFTTLCLSRELTLRDYIYNYWIRFQKHLDESLEAEAYRQTWIAYLIVTDPLKRYYSSIGLRKNSKFANRLYERATHTYLDFLSFTNAHKRQYCYFKNSSALLENFILKYFSVQPP
jgi:hypothetical protein